ncbi:hypothetical protein VPH35_055443 [Triticum aestivum]
METLPTTMAKIATMAAPLRGLPEEIVVWEILVRLAPKDLLRCRAVCRAWRRVTSARNFLLAHHSRQPSLHLLYGYECDTVRPQNILAFDHQAATTAQLHTAARLKENYNIAASCDGILILSGDGKASSICCNPATREHTPLRATRDLKILGMYPHRPTGEYRVLLQRWYIMSYKGQLGFYVLALGTEQPPRYIGMQETSSAYFSARALVRDSLHWYPVKHHSENDPLRYPTESKPIIVFVAESFRRMRAPIVPSNSYIFEMDDTLGIYTHDDDMEIVDIWVLQNYEGEIWDFKYKIKLPIAKIRRQFEGCDDYWYSAVVPVDSRVLLLVSLDRCVNYVDSDGELVGSFHHGGGFLRASGYRLKQTLVSPTFFTPLEGQVVNDSPFV